MCFDTHTISFTHSNYDFPCRVVCGEGVQE